MRRYQTAGQLQGGGGYLDAEPLPHPRHVEFRGVSADASSSSADRPRVISISPDEEAVQGGGAMDDGSSVGDGKDVLRRSITSMEFHKNMINTRSGEWFWSPEQNRWHDMFTLPHFPKTLLFISVSWYGLVATRLRKRDVWANYIIWCISCGLFGLQAFVVGWAYLHENEEYHGAWWAFMFFEGFTFAYMLLTPSPGVALMG